MTNYVTRFIQTLPFLLLFLFVGCASNPASNNDQNIDIIQGSHLKKAILWKVKKPGIEPSYIFGTVHSEDERVVNLPEEINKAFNTAGTFAMEMLLDEKTSHEIVKGMYFSDGRTLKSVTSDKTYQQSIAEMAKKDMSERVVNLMKPWAVFTVLNMPEQKTGIFLDAMLYQLASKNQKRVIGLESMEEQLAVFNDMKIETQVSLLESTLESGEDLNKILDEIIEIYLTHDLQKILDLNDRYMALLDEKIADEFNQRLIIDRNKRMVERMAPLIESGNTFVAIGALHLPGKDGILSLLRKIGYEVDPEF